MNNLSNHYETLNVSKDASQEEIRGSYIALCKMFLSEPVLIQELTKSYEALKNRQVEVIAQLPALPTLPELPNENVSQLIDYKLRQREVQVKEVSGGASFRVAAMAAIILGISILGISMNKDSLSRVQFFSMEGIFPSSYVRSEMAPNGQAFPTTSAYLTGYALGKNDGNSSLYVNNSKNENDVYLKLLSVESNKKSVVRHVYIKGNTEFKIENLSTGKYEIQYLDLVAGLVGKSIEFSVEETKTLLGIKSSTLGVNLKTAVNGVLKVETVSIDAFNSLASL